MQKSQWAMVAARMKDGYAREAKERQGKRTDLVEKVPPSDGGKARDKAGEAVGVCGSPSRVLRFSAAFWRLLCSCFRSRSQSNAPDFATDGSRDAQPTGQSTQDAILERNQSCCQQERREHSANQRSQQLEHCGKLLARTDQCPL